MKRRGKDYLGWAWDLTIFYLGGEGRKKGRETKRKCEERPARMMIIGKILLRFGWCPQPPFLLSAPSTGFPVSLWQAGFYGGPKIPTPGVWCLWLVQSPLFFLLLIPQRGKGREKDRERSIHVRKKHWLVCTPTGDPTCNPNMCPDHSRNGDLSVCRMTPNQQSHTIPFF